MVLFFKNKKIETLVVEGMKCEHCVARVKDALKKERVNCEITLSEKLVKVTFDESKISLQQIKGIIEDLGFQCA